MTVRSRLEGRMDENALRLTTSMDFDENIFHYDILVDYAHVVMLERSGIIDRASASRILRALRQVERDGFDGLSREYEDVHEAIEARVIEIAGDDGRKMHTARSRNDEVATCLRMFVRDRILDILSVLLELRAVILRRAKENVNAVMPGFTHLQYAQPTKLSHHLLAYHDMLERDFQRLLDAFRRVNLSPLGSSAFAGTSFPVDRRIVAEMLGFDGIVENSMDGVASRDFLIESVFACSSLMLSFSRICEEIILWASEFEFVELPDEYSSSSSIMPQKKNPDTAEIIRAKAGRMIGDLAGVMAIYKAMPFAYNRDFQEMNRVVFQAMSDALLSARVMAGLLGKIRFRTDVMRERSGKGFSVATEIANLLVQKGIPFRTAHRIVGELAKREIFRPDASTLAEVARKFGADVEITQEEIESASIPENAVEGRNSEGGTSERQILEMIERRMKRIEEDEKIIASIRARISGSLKRLFEEVDVYAGKEGEDQG